MKLITLALFSALAFPSFSQAETPVLAEGEVELMDIASPAEIAAELLEEGFDELYDAYLKRLYKSEEYALFKYRNEEIKLYVRGVSKEGKLETGIEEHVQYSFGEIEWLQKF